MNFRRPKEPDPEINLIPFIDVLLVVLIFLMLSTTYSKFTELQINLPTADADQSRDRPRELIVACRPDVLVKGGDYTAATTAGASEVIAAGGKIVAIPFLSAHSTSALIERIRG